MQGPICSDYPDMREQPAYAIPQDVWPGNQLTLCWDDVKGYDTDIKLVEASIEAAWGQYLPLNIVWYRTCDVSVRYDVHVHQLDVRPSASVGFDSLRQAFANLNFGLKNWCDWQGRDGCIVYEANHEFGHILGLLHEQDRPDAPKNLPCEYTGESDPSYAEIGKYDPYSIMNYCARTNWPDCEDVHAVQSLYQ